MRMTPQRSPRPFHTLAQAQERARRLLPPATIFHTSGYLQLHKDMCNANFFPSRTREPAPSTDLLLLQC